MLWTGGSSDGSHDEGLVLLHAALVNDGGRNNGGSLCRDGLVGTEILGTDGKLSTKMFYQLIMKKTSLVKR